MSKNRHFTVIELLIVISILMILMSFLLPAFGKARRQSFAIVCANQLKQQGVAMFILTSEGVPIFGKGCLPNYAGKDTSGENRFVPSNGRFNWAGLIANQLTGSQDYGSGSNNIDALAEYALFKCPESNSITVKCLFLLMIINLFLRIYALEH